MHKGLFIASKGYTICKALYGREPLQLPTWRPCIHPTGIAALYGSFMQSLWHPDLHAEAFLLSLLLSLAPSAGEQASIKLTDLIWRWYLCFVL
jgi:hypothetical protein